MCGHSSRANWSPDTEMKLHCSLVNWLFLQKPVKRLPQNVWPSKNILSPRKCYTDWSRYYFPHKRPPQNAWPFKNILSPRKCTECTVILSSRANLSPQAEEANILENRRRVTKKNVAILADSLPLSASRHNTMFLKNWQHLLYVYFSCVSEPKQMQATSQQNQKGGRFWMSQSDNSKKIITWWKTSTI